MYSNPRFQPILTYLQAHQRATIQELCALVYVSEATMRRDLSDLQDLGLLRRIHGGAVYTESAEELAITVRLGVNAADKNASAAVALPHLPDFDVLFVDNSSTCLALLRHMDLQHKTVVTNGLSVAQFLLEQGQARIIMPGGELSKITDLSGSMTCNTLRRFRFDLMLSSCAAISPDGTFENSLPIKELKSTAMELSAQRILVADKTKFAQRAPYLVSALSAYNAIYTNAPDSVLQPYQELSLPVFNQ